MMGIIVNTEGQICVTSDNVYDGTPTAINFDPSVRTLTLQFSDGSQQNLGTAGQSEICRLLHKVSSVRFMQIKKPHSSYRIQLPLYVRMDPAVYYAAAS